MDHIQATKAAGVFYQHNCWNTRLIDSGWMASCRRCKEPSSFGDKRPHFCSSSEQLLDSRTRMVEKKTIVLDVENQHPAELYEYSRLCSKDSSLYSQLVHPVIGSSNNWLRRTVAWILTLAKRNSEVHLTLEEAEFMIWKFNQQETYVGEIPDIQIQENSFFKQKNCFPVTIHRL